MEMESPNIKTFGSKGSGVIVAHSVFAFFFSAVDPASGFVAVVAAQVESPAPTMAHIMVRANRMRDMFMVTPISLI
jgi:hypothetical protein